MTNKTTEPAALAGIEPVAWMHDTPGRVECISAEVKNLWLKVGQPHQFMREIVSCKVEHYTTPLYSAATVERLVQERDELQVKWLAEQASALAAEAELELANQMLANKEMLSSVDRDAVQHGQEQLAASQAREQRLREALESLGQGFPATHQINAVIKHALALPQDKDTALREQNAKLLREMARGGCTHVDLLRKADELRAGK